MSTLDVSNDQQDIDERNYYYLVGVARRMIPPQVTYEPHELVHDAWINARKAVGTWAGRERWFSRGYLVQGIRWAMLQRFAKFKRELTTLVWLDEEDTLDTASVERQVEVLTQLEAVLDEAERNPNVALLIMAARGDDIARMVEETGISYSSLAVRRSYTRRNLRRLVA